MMMMLLCCVFWLFPCLLVFFVVIPRFNEDGKRKKATVMWGGLTTSVARPERAGQYVLILNIFSIGSNEKRRATTSVINEKSTPTNRYLTKTGSRQFAIFLCQSYQFQSHKIKFQATQTSSSSSSSSTNDDCFQQTHGLSCFVSCVCVQRRSVLSCVPHATTTTTITNNNIINRSIFKIGFIIILF
jgi:hypothetical protein